MRVLDIPQGHQGQQPRLDWLRFGASFFVVVAHSSKFIFDTKAGDEVGIFGWFYRNMFSGLGHEAVLMFFVLSGYFVFGGILNRGAQFAPLKYSVDRVSRLVPPMLLAIFFTLVVTMIVGEQVNLVSTVTNTLFLQGVVQKAPLQNNPSFWTLSYEFWFYVIGLGLGCLISKRPKTLLFGYGILCTAMIVFTELRSSYLFCWVLGGIAFIRRPEKLRVGWLWVAIGILVAGWCARHHQLFSGGVGEFLAFCQGQQHAMKILFSAAVCVVIWASLREAQHNEKRRGGISLEENSRHFPIVCIWCTTQ